MATIMNIIDASKYLGKTPAALRNGYKKWRIPHFRLGGQIKFTQEALDAWMAKGIAESQQDVKVAA